MIRSQILSLDEDGLEELAFALNGSLYMNLDLEWDPASKVCEGVEILMAMS